MNEITELMSFFYLSKPKKLKISKKRMNKGVATQTVKTCGRRVVDLQPIQNGFLYFSSICFSLRLFF